MVLLLYLWTPVTMYLLSSTVLVCIVFIYIQKYIHTYIHTACHTVTDLWIENKKPNYLTKWATVSILINIQHKLLVWIGTDKHSVLKPAVLLNWIQLFLICKFDTLKLEKLLKSKHFICIRRSFDRNVTKFQVAYLQSIVVKHVVLQQ
jgi:hypothetical protein